MDGRLRTGLARYEVWWKLIVYLVVDPDANNLRHVLKILRSRFVRQAQRFRISDMAIVLVQVFCNDVHVHLHEPVTPFVHEFHLRRFGVGHLGEVI